MAGKICKQCRKYIRREGMEICGKCMENRTEEEIKIGKEEGLEKSTGVSKKQTKLNW